MIARRRLAHPTWHLATPHWTFRLPRRHAGRSRAIDDAVIAERTARQGARELRANAIRIDAERHWLGVGRR